MPKYIEICKVYMTDLKLSAGHVGSVRMSWAEGPGAGHCDSVTNDVRIKFWIIDIAIT